MFPNANSMFVRAVVESNLSFSVQTQAIQVFIRTLDHDHCKVNLAFLSFSPLEEKKQHNNMEYSAEDGRKTTNRKQGLPRKILVSKFP